MPLMFTGGFDCEGAQLVFNMCRGRSKVKRIAVITHGSRSVTKESFTFRYTNFVLIKLKLIFFFNNASQGKLQDGGG